jgi:signal peptidase
MEPSFYRGDILFINWDYTPPTPGDIVVFKIPNQEIPIVHRTIAVQPLYGFNKLVKMVTSMH